MYTEITIRLSEDDKPYIKGYIEHGSNTVGLIMVDGPDDYTAVEATLNKGQLKLLAGFLDAAYQVLNHNQRAGNED